MTSPSLYPFQQQALDALRKQQDSYLDAVKAWQSSASAASGFSAPAMPEMPKFDAFPAQPTPAEMADANQLFLTRVFEEQQKFFTSLNALLQPRS